MIPLDAKLARTIEGGPSFALRSRILRIVWALCWILLARFTPPPLHSWRRLILRVFGAKVGRGARVYGSSRIWWPGNLELGAQATLGPGTIIYNQGRICIGARSVISQRAHLCASSHDINDPHFQLLLRPITIGANCWVAAEAFVGPGVVMDDHAVLGARAALFSDAAAQGVYSGNPAQQIKQRLIGQEPSAPADHPK